MKYSTMKDVLEEKDFHFKKKFGQNFIKDEKIITSMVSKIDIDKDTLVIEIGPGAGSLTSKLAPLSKKVLCYEIDDSLKDILSTTLEEYENVEVIYKDFLKANIKNDIKDEYKKIYVVANLPYYITTPIIEKIIKEAPFVDKIVVMVQKEVGERFKAIEKTKEYGSLTVYLNYFFDIKKLLNVSRNVFLPKPNVDSVIMELSKKKNKRIAKNEDVFFKLIQDAFSQKRKMLRNNLKQYDLKLLEEVLSTHGKSLMCRAEEISLDIYLDMADVITKKPNA